MAKPTRPGIAGFKGLNNLVDPLRLPPEYQTRADNVDLTAQGGMVRARGFTRASTNYAISGAYATEDRQRLFVVDTGELRQYAIGAGSYIVLASGLNAARTHFAEANGIVFYANGTDFGVIERGGVRSWGLPNPPAPHLTRIAGSMPAGLYRVFSTYVDARGLESGSGDVAFIDLPADSGISIDAIDTAAGSTWNLYVTACDGTVFFRLVTGHTTTATYNKPPEQLGGEFNTEFWQVDPPRGTLPAFWKGRLFTAEGYPELDLTAIWPSLPLGYHHFDLEAGFLVPGTVRMLAASDTALIIGTERELYAFDGSLNRLADYGVPSGYPAARRGVKDLYFWTQRGACKAMPFVNLSETLFSVPPGVTAAASVMERDGQTRFVVALQKGGTAYNARS